MSRLITKEELRILPTGARQGVIAEETFGMGKGEASWVAAQEAVEGEDSPTGYVASGMLTFSPADTAKASTYIYMSRCISISYS